MSGDDFDDDERSTANLRLRSVSPTQRTLLGFFALTPRAWRGVVAVVAIAALTFLAYKLPALVTWLKGTP